MIRLDKEFFCRETSLVARELLGKVMVHHSPEGDLAGIVVETEAYLGAGDPGSHSSRGMTRRNAVMFGPCGRSYIYRIYGIHCCYNVTTDQDPVPAAVLIRALRPLAGIDTMRLNRKKQDPLALCSGPGKLVQALGIPQSLNGICALTGPIGFYDLETAQSFAIHQTTRIGLSQGREMLLRYYIQGDPNISRK